MCLHIERIVSGGQTGADRAALDWAIKNNIPHGGWCPKGRLAEDGLIPLFYNLTETTSEDYAVRTAWNARDSDATIIFSIDEVLAGGSALTRQLALEYEKPILHVHAGYGIHGCVARIKSFFCLHCIKVLNIAGPRASEEQDIGLFVKNVLDLTLN
jgi:hypothetical protein